MEGGVRFPLTYIANLLYLYYMPSQWTIEFLNDKVEQEFDQFPADIRAKLVHIATLIAEFGLPNIGEPYIRHIQDNQ